MTETRGLQPIRVHLNSFTAVTKITGSQNIRMEFNEIESKKKKREEETEKEHVN